MPAVALQGAAGFFVSYVIAEAYFSHAGVH
jgi:hypothetical protein